MTTTTLDGGVKMKSKGLELLVKEVYNSIEVFAKEAKKDGYEDDILKVKDKKKAIEYIVNEMNNDDTFWEHIREGWVDYLISEYIKKESK